jgi:tRNA-2-methylthio-N6-dimethylallyladenosine synthase
LELVRRARELIPGLAVTTDIISGFCGETEEEHRDTVSRSGMTR